MGSLDIDSFFVKLGLDKTVDISVNLLFENNDAVEGFINSEAGIFG